MNNADEWVTIAEAARLLLVSERQTRRLALRLSAGDRLTSGKSPARVRLSAIEALRVSGIEGHAPDTRSQNGVRPESGLTDTLPDSTSGPLLEALQGEITFLRTQIAEKDAQIQRRDQAEGELRRLMLADRQEIARLREQLLISAPDPEASPEGQRLQEGTGEGKRRRPWWDRLLGRR